MMADKLDRIVARIESVSYRFDRFAGAARADANETQWWAHALTRKGTTLHKAGPHKSREEAIAAAWAAKPQAHRVSSGYGSQGAHFDIRDQTHYNRD